MSEYDLNPFAFPPAPKIDTEFGIATDYSGEVEHTNSYEAGDIIKTQDGYERKPEDA